MPRQPKKPLPCIPKDTLTGGEVAVLFRQATAVGPWLDTEACRSIAEFINLNVGIGSPPPELKKLRREADAASHALHRFIEANRFGDATDSTVSFLDVDLADLQKTLRKCEQYWTMTTTKNPEWSYLGICLANFIAWALSNLDREAGRSRTSVLVCFVSLLLTRAGYRSATPANIEAQFQKWNYYPGRLQNTSG